MRPAARPEKKHLDPEYHQVARVVDGTPEKNHLDAENHAGNHQVARVVSNDVDPLETPYTGSTLDLIHCQVHPFHGIE